MHKLFLAYGSNLLIFFSHTMEEFIQSRPKNKNETKNDNVRA